MFKSNDVTYLNTQSLSIISLIFSLGYGLRLSCLFENFKSEINCTLPFTVDVQNKALPNQIN